MSNTPYNPQIQAPQPGQDSGGCCCECYSSSLGNSNLQQNPVPVNAESPIQVANVNPSRKELFLINTSAAGVVYIGLGFQPTQTQYSLALIPCSTSDDDGTGGIWISDMWQGAIFAIAFVDGCKLNFTEQV